MSFVVVALVFWQVRKFVVYLEAIRARIKYVLTAIFHQKLDRLIMFKSLSLKVFFRPLWPQWNISHRSITQIWDQSGNSFC